MDSQSTYAFLVAVSQYTADESLHALNQAWTNVQGLDKILRSQSIGLTRDHIVVMENPTDKTRLTTELRNIATKDGIKTLVIYYAGHGILDENSCHYLTLTNSTVENIDIDGYEITEINKALSKNKNLTVILLMDSCFSEKAFDNFLMSNYLLIASSARNRTSKYPVDSDFSAFTNELLNILKNGIDNGKNEITWREVYSNLKKNLVEKGFPVPKISSQNEVDEIVVAKNNFAAPVQNFDNQWVNVIKNISKENPSLQEEVQLIIDSQSPQMINELKQKLLQHFPYPISHPLSKLFGKEPSTDAYLNLFERILQFLSFVYLAQLEKCRSKNNFAISSECKILLMRIDSPDDVFYMELLPVLISELKKNNIDIFIHKIDFSNTKLQNAINQLHTAKTNAVSIDIIKKAILILIESISILVNYKLISIREVRVNFPKYKDIKYNHSISLLQGDEPVQYENWEKMGNDFKKLFSMRSEATNTNSILFIHYNKQENSIVDYINLHPLFIDSQAIMTEKNKKTEIPDIYFYSGKNENDQFLYQNVTSFEKNDSKPYNELNPFDLGMEIFEKQIL